MAAGDYDELEEQLSPPDKVKWIVVKFLARWVKIDRRNAPVEKKSPGEMEVPIQVTPSDKHGAELSVSVTEIVAKMPRVEATFVVNGAIQTAEVLIVEDAGA